jgi:hypothetical protein
VLRIAVIGNCHAGPLKQGWDLIKQDFPGIDLCFFASAGTRLNDLAIEGRSLVPRCPELRKDLLFFSGGRERIEVSGFDAFLVQGLGVKVHPIDSRLSDAVKLCAARGWFDNTVGGRTCAKLRKLTAAPIYMGIVPLLREPVAPRSHAVRYEEAVELMARANAAAGVVFLPQPGETVVNGWATSSAYCDGATRLENRPEKVGVALPEEDCVHMNPEFGRVFMHAFLSASDAVKQPIAA